MGRLHTSSLNTANLAVMKCHLATFISSSFDQDGEILDGGG